MAQIVKSSRSAPAVNSLFQRTESNAAGFITRLSAFCVLLLGLTTSLRADPPGPIIQAWLEAQEKIQTWTADFTQTRSLKALAQPLTSEGQVWFAHPNQFRWELGNPPQTIAIRQPQQLLVIYPRLKRVERFPLEETKRAGPWNDALALLEAGFPRDEADLQSKFRILDQTQTVSMVELTLEPRSSGARRMMSRVKIAFDPATFMLQGTELHFADGSTLRNDFKNVQLNPPLDAAAFTPRIESDYRIVEPAGK
jgi:outer membrane lipoprotein carrier protein